MTEQEKWENDNGDFTKIIDYPLNEDSQVIEVGGYIGEWTTKVISKFNPKMLLIEPVPEFYKKLLSKFSSNPKVFFDNSALSTEEKKIKLSVYHSQTSSFVKVSDSTINVKAYPIDFFLEKYKINKIDLIQINIECEEYPLLINWLKSDVLDKIKFLQVQFHTFCDNYEEEYLIVAKGLKERGFELRYRYDFVWESWENKKIN